MSKYFFSGMLLLISLSAHAQRFSMESEEGKRDLIFVAIILSLITTVVILQVIKYRKDKE